MNLAQIASAVLSRQNPLAPRLVSESMRQQLGPDGIAEAVRRGWLEVDQEIGGLRCTHAAAKLEEMRAAANADPAPAALSESARSSTGARDLWQLHGSRVYEAASVVEHRALKPVTVEAVPFALPGAGHGVRLFEQDDEYVVGDPVRVAEGGEVFDAVVQAVEPGGRLVLSFGQQKKPSVVKAAYDKTEVEKIAPAGAPQAPKAPAASSTSTPPTGTAPTGTASAAPKPSQPGSPAMR